MQVLPRQATLASFVGVLVTLTLATFLATLDWHRISAAAAQALRRITGRYSSLTATDVIILLGFEIPKYELTYGASLLQPPSNSGEYSKPRFSWKKFISDIFRISLLPLWATYLAVLYVLSAIGSTVTGVWRCCTGRRRP